MEHEASISSSCLQASADAELTAGHTDEVLSSRLEDGAAGNEEAATVFEIDGQEDLESNLEVQAVVQPAEFGNEMCDDMQQMKKKFLLDGSNVNIESKISPTVGPTDSQEKCEDSQKLQKVHDESITQDSHMYAGADDGEIDTEQSSFQSSDTQNAFVDIPIKSHQADTENILSGRKGGMEASLHNISSDKSTSLEQMQSDSVGKTSSFIEKHLDESSNVQCKEINVFIIWQDSTSGDESVKWIHENCAECRDRYVDWKKHVLEKHKMGNGRGGCTRLLNNKDDMGSLSTDSQKRAKTIVKTEVLDEDISTKQYRLTASLPRITLKLSTVKNQKRGRKPSKITRKQSSSKAVKQRAPKEVKRDRTPEIKLEKYVSDDDADVLGSEEVEVPNVSLPNKRKRGRPRKLIEKPMEEPPKSDTDNSEKEDPDYQPDDQARQKPSQKKGRPGRPRKLNATPAKTYKCNHEDCDMTFSKLRERKNHEKEAHTVEFKCKHEGCESAFKTAFKRNKHEVDEHGALFECEHCDLTFTSQKERTAHVKTHVSFKCEFENCGKSYAMEDYLKVHQKTHYADKSHVCQICSKAFISIRYLNRHMKIHTERTHQCESCPKSFKTRAALAKHSRRHTGEGLLVCQFCGKKLNGIVSLQRHERVHTGDKPFQCKYCDKRFVCQGSLQSHEQEHTGLQWICEKCGKKFKTKGNLQEHERIHTGEKPCKCQFCGKSYAAGSSLWKHVTSRHSGYKRYKCDVCGKLFARYNGLSKHKTVHTGIRNYECKYCHKMFTTSSIRRGHYKQVHLGIKRTGHQGRAKKLKEEAKRLAALKQEADDQKLYIDENKDRELVQDPKMTVDQSDTSSSGTNQATDAKATPSQGLLPPTSRRIPSVHQLIPIDFSRDRRPGMLPPHGLPPDPSRSDFYTMVDSLIQFSKEH